MRRRIILLILLIVCAVSATACSDDRKDGDAVTPTTAASPAGSEPSGTVIPTGTPEVSPGPNPQDSITPTPASELAAMIVRNRELHEAVRPKTVANPLGTGADSKHSEKDTEYGIVQKSHVYCTLIDPVTGEDVPWDTTIPVMAFRISGLNDRNVQEKVNERILSAVRTMSDPGYIPNASGILTIIKERGLPESVWIYPEEKYNENGVLTIELEGSWRWTEEREFSTSKEFDDFVATKDWPYTFSVTSADDNWTYPVNYRLIYSVPENIYLNFDLATGEEMSLSDLFAKGSDYLSLLNEKAAEDSRYFYWFSHNGKEEIEIYDEYREYDGGALLPTIRGNEQFCPSRYDDLKIFSEQGRQIDLYGTGWSSGSNDGKSMYQVDEYETLPIGTVYLSCGPDLSDDSAKYRAKVGSFRAKSVGSREVKVTVYRNSEPTYSESEEFDAESLNLTDPQILEIAEQCVAYWADEGIPDRDFTLFLDAVEKYPNGYDRSYWTVVCREDGYNAEEPEQAWVKDGKVVPQEELFDISYRELLTEILVGLHTGDRDSGKPVIADRDAAEKIADVLMNYFVGLYSIPGGSCTGWMWNDFYFDWKDFAGVHYGGPNCFAGDEILDLEEHLPDLKEVLPEVMWNRLVSNDTAGEQPYLIDPNVILKHLRMYAGYEF